MYETIICDLDGTIYLDDLPIGQVVSEVNRLQKKGMKFHFLTNNTSRSHQYYIEKINKLGINAKSDEVHNPTIVASNYLLKKFGENAKAFVLGTEEFQKDLVKYSKAEIVHDSPDYVIVAFDLGLEYKKLRKACSYISQGVPFYQTHIDNYCPSEDGPMPDCGAICEMIYLTTKVRPLKNFGKPSQEMISYFKNIVENDNKIAFLGDRLNTDIVIGRKLGAYTVFVESGADTLKMLEEVEIQPDKIFKNTHDFLKTIQ